MNLERLSSVGRIGFKNKSDTDAYFWYYGGGKKEGGGDKQQHGPISVPRLTAKARHVTDGADFGILVALVIVQHKLLSELNTVI